MDVALWWWTDKVDIQLVREMAQLLGAHADVCAIMFDFKRDQLKSTKLFYFRRQLDIHQLSWQLTFNLPVFH